MLGGAVAVDRVEQALALAAGVEAVGIDVGQRAVGREGQVLQVAREAEQRRVTGLGVDAGHDDGVGADALAVLAAVATEEQDVDPLLRPERVGAVHDRRRLAVVGEDARDEVALGAREPAGEDRRRRDGEKEHPDHDAAQHLPAARGVRRQQHPVAGDDDHHPQQGEDGDRADAPEQPADVDRGTQGCLPSSGREPDRAADDEQEDQQGDGAELAPAGREERRPGEEGAEDGETEGGAETARHTTPAGCAGHGSARKGGWSGRRSRAVRRVGPPGHPAMIAPLRRLGVARPDSRTARSEA